MAVIQLGRAGDQAMEAAGIVYLDEQILVLNKPPGLSLATPRLDPQAAVRRLLERVPAAARNAAALSAEGLWLVHRLDVGTSGLVILARDSGTHKQLSRGFAERRIEKDYLALVWGHPRPKEGVWDWPLGPDRADRRRMKVDSAGRPARTRYKTIADAPHVSLLRLQPETGRTHQIRVHLARAGHWIVGDDLYGGPRHKGVRQEYLREALNPGHTLLHASRLKLPIRGGMLELKAALPHSFSQVLSILGIALE